MQQAGESGSADPVVLNVDEEVSSCHDSAELWLLVLSGHHDDVYRDGSVITFH